MVFAAEKPMPLAALMKLVVSKGDGGLSFLDFFANYWFASEL